MSTLSQVGFYALLGAATLTLGAALYIRSVDTAHWGYDVDPLKDRPSGRPNAFFVAPTGHPALQAESNRVMESPVFPMPPGRLQARLDALITSDSSANRLPTSGPWRAFVLRSRIMGFPDYVTFRAVTVEGGSMLALHSRARFGRTDFGVNRRRVERWLEALADPPAEQTENG